MINITKKSVVGELSPQNGTNQCVYQTLKDKQGYELQWNDLLSGLPEGKQIKITVEVLGD